MCNIGHIKYKSNHEIRVNVTQTLNHIIKSKNIYISRWVQQNKVYYNNYKKITKNKPANAHRRRSTK